MQDGNENNENDYIPAVLEYNGYNVGHVVEIKQSICSSPQQCRIMTIANEGDAVTMTVYMLTRPWVGTPVDFQKRGVNIFEYWETNETLVINANIVRQIVPSCTLTTRKPKLDKLMNEMKFSAEDLKKGCIYISKFYDGVGRTYPPVDGAFTWNWFNFDLMYANFRERDALNEIWFILKAIVFNPFVSALTNNKTYKSVLPGGTSTRPRMITIQEPNIDLWQYLIMNRDVRNYQELKARLLQTARTGLLYTDKMIFPKISIPFIVNIIREFTEMIMVPVREDDKEYRKLRKEEVDLVSSGEEDNDVDAEVASKHDTEPDQQEHEAGDDEDDDGPELRRAYATEIWHKFKQWDKQASDLHHSMDKMDTTVVGVMDDALSMDEDGEPVVKEKKKRKRKPKHILIDDEASDGDDEDDEQEDDDAHSDDVGSLASFIVAEEDGDEEEADDEQNLEEGSESSEKGAGSDDEEEEVMEPRKKVRVEEEPEPVTDLTVEESNNELDQQPVVNSEVLDEEKEEDEICSDGCGVLDTDSCEPSDGDSSSDEDSDTHPKSKHSYDGETDPEDEIKEFDEISYPENNIGEGDAIP